MAVAAPAERSKFSLVAPQNFLHPIGDRPFLTIIGTHDELCPVEHARGLQALFEAKAKDQVLLDAGHKLPVEYVPYAVGWLRKHL